MPGCVKFLVCIYTCSADQLCLAHLQRTDFMHRLRSDPRYDVLEVYADDRLDTPAIRDGILTVPCRESYDQLSVKTHLMVSSVMSRQFDFLVKIDSDFAMSDRRPRKAALSNLPWSTEAADSLLQNLRPRKTAYGGLLLTRSTRSGMEQWMRKKGLTGDYRSVFPLEDTTPDYYLGPFYFMRRDLCEFVAAHGATMAQEHQQQLGGSEDIMIGRLYKLWQESELST